MNDNKYIGRECPSGHDGLRYKSNSACVTCSKERLQRPGERERLRASNKRLYVKIRDQRLDQQRSYRNTVHGRAKQMLQGARKRAEERGGDMTLSLEWIVEKIEAGRCELSGLPFDLTRAGVKSPYVPSVDRIDSSLGYVPENCRVILWALNTAFSHWGADVFREIAIAWLSDCGALHDRDHNAAKNILATARSASRLVEESRLAA